MTSRATVAVAKLRSVLPYDIRRTIVITGSPRSGTTWLAEMVATHRGHSILWEPDHLDNAPQARSAGLGWRTQLDAASVAPDIEAYIRRVLSGKSLNWWTTRLVDGRRLTRTWVVKFVRANRMLPWITATFPVRRPLLLLRHPCAVVASQIEWGFEAGDSPPEEGFVARHPHLRPLYERITTPEERLAFVWAADAYAPLMAPDPGWRVLLFEELVRDPMAEMTSVFGGWGMDVPLSLGSRVRTASSTASRRRGSEVGQNSTTDWRDRLSEDQIRRILAVTAAFGLDFYDADPAPHLDHPLLTADR